MRYYSTRSEKQAVSFTHAALAGLAPDGGLFVPEEIPNYPAPVKSSLGAMGFCDIAFETIRLYTGNEIPGAALADIVNSAFSFDAPLVPVGQRLALELFHGPTAAFKDFGARFMARAFAFLRRGEDKPLHILTATSGDTGGAVADGFFDVPGITVTVLYPKGRVTPLQEKQIAGFGKNICALAVEGSFDDCQKLVKAALADQGLKRQMALSSANSINICRLIPQAVYYAAAAGKAFAGKIDSDAQATPRINKEVMQKNCVKKGAQAIFCVPSGNFGNLTAGLYAMKMGAPVSRFIAATNINKTVPDYLDCGEYTARPSAATISNAMDVGAPSNFERMAAHFSLEQMRSLIMGVSVTDDETLETIAKVYNEADYILDPHSAVAWKGLDKLYADNKITGNQAGILCTAHPAKFAQTVEPITGHIPVPASIACAMGRSINAQTIPAELSALLESLR